jgi:hypothetical protein
VEAIRLEGDGDCPHCGRLILGFAAGACAFCGMPFGPWLEALPAARARLDVIAPGWTPDRLRAWALPRPAQLAWAFDRGAWARLAAWMDEDMREGLARLEMSRRGRGRGSRLDHQEVDAVRLQALGDEADWVALRIEGRRCAAPFDRLPDPDASPAAEAFTEWWCLRPTGRPERDPECPCPSCGAPVPFEADHCTHCGTAPPREPGPWRVEGIVTKGEGESWKRLHLQGRSAFMPRV